MKDNNISAGAFKITTAERKLLIILCYYIIATVFSLTFFAEFSRKSRLFGQELTKYFVCERYGHNPAAPCDRQGFEKLSPTIVGYFSTTLVDIMPSVYLVFAINLSELKHKCLWCWRKMKADKTDAVPSHLQHS